MPAACDRHAPRPHAPELVAGHAGEQGAQVRDLLEQNPVVALPVIYFRLQQKDREWCAPPAYGPAVVRQL